MIFLRQLPRMLIAVGLILAGIWLLRYGQLQRKVHFQEYAYTEEEAAELKGSAVAQYDYGHRALDLGNYEKAAEYLKAAVQIDPLHISAWLKLAEAEKALGRRQKAADIVAHTHGLTRRVLRWKWPETLLAFELKMDQVFAENVNFLVEINKQRWDAVRLLDLYCSRQAEAALDVLAPANRLAYMQWLMRWKRTDEVRLAWQSLPETLRRDSDCRLSYADYLVGQRQVVEARRVWNEDGAAGIENGGFERVSLQKGFDWRFRDDPDRLYRIRQVRAPEDESNHVLEVKFSGRRNLKFHHLYQIVPVRPGADHRLYYRWRADEISTDQGPFVEIYGYGCDARRADGPMMLGSAPWQWENLEFTAPEDCHAMVVRLRRNPSGRFDNKIAGTLWLDDFQLTRIRTASRKTIEETVHSER